MIDGLAVTPSQVRAFIRFAFPKGVPLKLERNNSGTVLGVLMMTEKLNPAILIQRFSSEERIEWFIAISAIHQKLRQWAGGDDGAFGKEANGEQAVGIINRLLEKCPDAATPHADDRLQFIKDKDLRTSIGRDIDSLDVMLKQGEWKAVTVMGGSIVEALLLDVLLGQEPAALTAAKKFAPPKKSFPPRLQEWNLFQMIKVAKELSIIGDSEFSACDSVRGYRNLIHPGKERTTESCNQGTAQIACGAVNVLVEKFSHAP